MNKELIKIIESLCERIPVTNAKGATVLKFKPELCRLFKLTQPFKCSFVACNNCLFARKDLPEKTYAFWMHKAIQMF